MNPDISEQIKKGLDHHQRGQLQQAQAIYQSILDEQPEHVDALHLLGVLSLQVGNGEAAVALIEKAIRLKPDEAEFHNMCGEAYRALGKYDSAISCYEQAIAIRPAFAGAYTNLGSALKELGRLDDAVSNLQQAIAIDPAYPVSHNNLGVALKDLGRPAEAIGHFERALEIAPGYAEAHTNLGNAIQESGRPEDAIHHHNQALAINPEFAEAHGNLGNTFRMLGRLDDAVKCYRQAIALQPGFAVAHYNLGIALNELGWPDEAVASYESALAIRPEFAAAHHNLANALSELGKRDEAIAHYSRAIAIRPEYAEAYRNLTRVNPTEEHLASVQALLGDSSLSNTDATHLHFALGNIYNSMKRFDQAFEHFSKGNHLKRKTFEYDPQSFSDYVDELIRTFSKQHFASVAKAGSDSTLPVFVVGMPRSGTSLVEQVIASHPNVFGAGELVAMAQIEQEIQRQGGESALYPGCIVQCGNALLRQLANQYLDTLKIHSPNADRVTDKMPDNFMRIGLIKTLFPHARIVHCKRNPLDTCISSYFNYFATGNQYSFDLRELGQYYLDYERLMEHWYSMFSSDIFGVQYESMVADQETTSRALIEYIDLDWDDACLNFYTNMRAVNTFSSLQVRQPIYTDAVSRWRHFEKHLAPISDLFSPTL